MTYHELIREVMRQVARTHPDPSTMPSTAFADHLVAAVQRIRPALLIPLRTYVSLDDSDYPEGLHTLLELNWNPQPMHPSNPRP